MRFGSVHGNRRPVQISTRFVDVAAAGLQRRLDPVHQDFRALALWRIGPPQDRLQAAHPLKLIAAVGADKKIVLIAGRPSHGPAQHEHRAGCLLIKSCLDKVQGVSSIVYSNGWPNDSTALNGADAIIIYADGGTGHPALQDDHLKTLGELMKKGVGLGCIHYAVELPKEKGGPAFLQWIGGYFEMYWSVNPTWTAEFKSFPSHPITRGVKPFKIQDEWYYHMRFPEGMQNVTPILTAIPPENTRGKPGADGSQVRARHLVRLVICRSGSEAHPPARLRRLAKRADARPLEQRTESACHVSAEADAGQAGVWRGGARAEASPRAVEPGGDRLHAGDAVTRRGHLPDRCDAERPHEHGEHDPEHGSCPRAIDQVGDRQSQQRQDGDHEQAAGRHVARQERRARAVGESAVRRDEAVALLTSLLQFDVTWVSHLRTDPDLNSLRDYRPFRALLVVPPDKAE